MFDELLFIFNFVINVFYECHRMITKAMRRSQKVWSVCSTLGWSLQGQIELHDIVQDCLRIARGVPVQMEVLGLNKDGAQSIDDVFYVCSWHHFLYLLHFFV